MDHDGQVLTEIVLPLMNVDRRDVQGDIDPTEPNQQQIMITSAGEKGSYAYQKLTETFIQSIVSPESAFVWGCDYRVPMMHGLLNKKFIQEIKLSSTYNEDSFAREYLSIKSLWTLNLLNREKISLETIRGQAIKWQVQRLLARNRA